MNDKIAIYLRLSLADGDLKKGSKDESNSIENQRMLLHDYIGKQEDLFGEIIEYVDDGYTGTNFNRPAFQKMIVDLKQGDIKVIMVKDLSRLGRDYIGVGDYIEQIFPLMGVRFIAVNNSFDSMKLNNGTPGIEVAVSNLVNNMYSRDIAKKIRAALETNWKNGKATCTNVPFGYVWNKKGGQRWEIDPEAAPCVKKVFELALSGRNTTQIAYGMNELNLPTPGLYAKRKNLLMGSNPIIAPDSEMLWNAAIVWRILRRYEYTGALVMGRRKKIDSRKTKLGRVEWNPGTLAGVLANERHCGDVLARKTFTPNFLTHKSKKNNNDRTQYRQKNHHEAIVSREVFNAANHLRASRNYSKKDRPLPVLSVVEDGILRGYVPFDKDWTGFSAEEYRKASESVMKEPDVTVTADVKKRLDLTGYEIVRVQYFSTMQNPAMTISNGRLRFNTACLKKFENVEYVELLLNSVERCIAIRPCDKNNPNAIRWGRLKEGRWCASTLGCRGLAKTLFDIMEWDEDLRYRFRGQFLEQGDNKMMLFAFDEPEMIKVEEIVLPPKENTEEDEGETVKKKIYIFPPEWAGTFGQPITSIAQVGILRQEHYAGNWDVFRPATEIEEMNIFTAESLNELLREAEKIMEGWTDYR